MRSDVEVRAVGTARYPEEFKQDAIKLVASAGSSIDSGLRPVPPTPHDDCCIQVDSLPRRATALLKHVKDPRTWRELAHATLHTIAAQTSSPPSVGEIWEMIFIWKLAETTRKHSGPRP
ncbi:MULTISPECIES: hypothetical protein [Streptomyces]|uniref:hypothetical protein n=1 Tax=Streptomyces TaxID=1883 RepID=UPI00131A9E25|nr:MULTISPECIES: hypothetical protein [Streptomyces]